MKLQQRDGRPAQPLTVVAALAALAARFVSPALSSSQRAAGAIGACTDERRWREADEY
jgi:hypothetical protein